MRVRKTNIYLHWGTRPELRLPEGFPEGAYVQEVKPGQVEVNVCLAQPDFAPYRHAWLEERGSGLSLTLVLGHKELPIEEVIAQSMDFSKLDTAPETALMTKATGTTSNATCNSSAASARWRRRFSALSPTRSFTSTSQAGRARRDGRTMRPRRCWQNSKAPQRAQSRRKDSARSYLPWATSGCIFLVRNSANDHSQAALLRLTGAAGTGGGNPSGRVEPNENSSAFGPCGWVQVRPAVLKASPVALTKWTLPAKTGKGVEPIIAVAPI